MASFGPNEWLVDEIYQQYLQDPNSVDRAWWDFFADYKPSEPSTPSTPAGQATVASPSGPTPVSGTTNNSGSIPAPSPAQPP